MTKRFTSYKNNSRIVGFKDNVTGKHHSSYLEGIWILNELWEKNQRIEKHYELLKKENRELKQENEQLKSRCNDYDKALKTLQDLTDRKLKENEQLKQRNDRQAKQLDRLYQLISQKDWRTLSDILDDFKRCEEQLQRESGTYW